MKGVAQETASWKKDVAADMAPLEEDAKVWSKNWLLDKRGVAADVASRKRIQRCGARNGFLEERRGS
jgi:endonuclease YncB( thermonuclease family)